jgi:hypothetical protein
MFVAVACLSFAAEPGARRGGAVSPEMAKARQAAATMADKYVAKECGLTGEKAEKLCAALASQREAFTKKMAEARGGGGADFAALMQERTKGIEGVVDANLTGDQAKKAKELLALGLDSSIGALLGAKVEAAKIEQAMPILVKCAKAVAELRAKSQGAPSEEMRTKQQELRAAAAKELEPIVGAEGAKAFQESRGGFMGMGGGRGGKKKAE